MRSQRRSLEESAQVGDAVLQHADPLQPHAEGEALPARGIDAAVLQHLRVDHAAAEDLQPVIAVTDAQRAAGARAADVDLGGRLGEREVAGAKAHRQVVEREVGAQKLDQAALQVAHVRALVDDQALDLVEHRRVRCVVVRSVGAARRDDADRRLLRQHRPHLHRRGVGAQNQPAAVALARQVEGVHLLPRRMLGRDVERAEVGPVVLDVRPLRDGEAHLAEDRDDLVDRLADRVDAPLARRRAERRARRPPAPFAPPAPRGPRSSGR